MLELRGVRAGYGAIEALHGVSLRVDPGEIVTVIGANGAGKSTTLMAISGLVRPTAGEILFRGAGIAGMEAAEIAALGLCQVPEGRRIFPDLTVLENLMMGAYLRDQREARGDLGRVHELFPVLADRSSQPGGTLSGGEQQMLAIGRALMQRPRLLMLDEPSLGLAPIVVTRIFETVREINREDGVPVLLVEQNAFLALKVADRGYVLEGGRVRASDRAAALMENPDIKRAYLGIA